jgi:CPA2 family monovalent cation:H+ antiporter-2
MGITPFIFKFGQNITELLVKAPIPRFIKNFVASDVFRDPEIKQKKTFKNHLIVIGYGLNGQNVVKAARYALIPYVILDINADTVKREREQGETIYFGDAVNIEVLDTVCVKTAKVVVVAISDPVATRRVVANVRSQSQNVQIVVRTRYINEIEELKRIGANSVITEEFETSIEIFTRVLSIYMIPGNEVEKLISVIRADSYEMLRSISPRPGFIDSIDANLAEVNLANLKVPSKCKIAGKSLAQADMRKQFGVTLLAIKRDREIINNPPGNTRLEEDDILYVFGEPNQIINFKNYIES